MGFDLNKNNYAEQSEAGFEFELLTPELQEPTGAFIKVRGVKSAKVKAFARKKLKERQLQQNARARKGKEQEFDIEEAEDMLIEMAVQRIISWKGIEEDGKAVPFTEENATRILKEHDWIRDQIMEESDNLVNFMK